MKKSFFVTAILAMIVVSILGSGLLCKQQAPLTRHPQKLQINLSMGEY